VRHPQDFTEEKQYFWAHREKGGRLTQFQIRGDFIPRFRARSDSLPFTQAPKRILLFFMDGRVDKRDDARFDPSTMMKSTSEPSESHVSLASLRLAAQAWVDRGFRKPLDRWLAKELDASGFPVRLPISTWTSVLGELARARASRTDWPEEWDTRIAAFFEAVLRFSRPTGLAATSQFDESSPNEIKKVFLAWADVVSGTGSARVASMWFPRRDVDESSPPPLPAWSSEKQVLAILRAEWLKSGDFLAVDHRDSGSSTTFELFGGGIPWLGPNWSLTIESEGPVTRPRIQAWSTSYTTDLFEWSFRIGSAKVTRTAILFRGRRLALLADQIDFAGESRPAAWTLDLQPGVRFDEDPESRSLVLKSAADRGSMRVHPLGLPCLPYKTDKGSIVVRDRKLILKQCSSARRIWLPVLLSWDSARNRKPVQWRGRAGSRRCQERPPCVVSAG